MDKRRLVVALFLILVAFSTVALAAMASSTSLSSDVSIASISRSDGHSTACFRVDDFGKEKPGGWG